MSSGTLRLRRLTKHKDFGIQGCSQYTHLELAQILPHLYPETAEPKS
jgi:hypothetical protein